MCEKLVKKSRKFSTLLKINTPDTYSFEHCFSSEITATIQQPNYMTNLIHLASTL